MQKQTVVFITHMILSFSATAQFSQQVIDQLKDSLNKTKTDSLKFSISLEISNDYRYTNIDSSLSYADKAVEFARSMNNYGKEAIAISGKGFIYLETGDLPLSLQYQFAALDLVRKSKDQDAKANILNRMGNIYMELGDYRNALGYYNQSKSLFASVNKPGWVYNEVSNIGNIYELMGQLDSSKYYLQQAYIFGLTNKDRYALTYGELRDRYGNVETRLGNYDSAVLHYRAGIRESLEDADFRNLASVYLHMSQLFLITHQNDSSFYYAKKAIPTARSIYWQKGIYEACSILVKLLKIKNQPDSALVYEELSSAVKDSLYGPDKVRNIQRILLGNQQKQAQLEKEKIATQNKIRTTTMMAGIAVFMIIAALLYRNSRNRKKANERLQSQKKEIEEQKISLEQTLTELKSTQSQLIQSEKMASLGELTAGIAHEIQNPLNFVNNFSEVNKELIGELKEEIKKGNIEEVNAIADDIEANQEKINHHGKRADAIVKGMLQHSRSGTGQKEPTDINALADEYLRLAYHGLRGKDNSFNATMIPIAIGTDFDQTIGNINIIPQDIGRVLLNLYNNAFYAVHEKKKSADANYEPLVSVSTKKIADKVFITVEDNSDGIPHKIVDKIFQPFFTTKPTGQGTGLGLSLSYDIVKAHGGEIKVKTKEGDGSEFIIQLPI